MLQSKNNVLQSMVKNTEGKEGIDLTNINARMAQLNDVFSTTIDSSKATEQRLQEALKAWNIFLEQQTKVNIVYW